MSQPWLLLIQTPQDQPDTTTLYSHLWSLGTTGIGEDKDRIVAGFPTLEIAESAQRELNKLSLVDTESIRLEMPPPLQHWVPHKNQHTVTVSDSSESHLITITSGQTFGHGGHPTTQLALNLLTETAPEATRMLDVGTGTGILAIAAKKLGVAEVVGIDIEPSAVEQATQNAKENDVSVDFSTSKIPQIVQEVGYFDLIAINVLLPVHQLLATSVLGAIATEATVIASGYLESQREQIRKIYSSLESAKTLHTDNWAGTTFVRH